MNKTVLALGVLAGVAFSANAFAADAAAGEKIAKTRCVACHSFDKGGPNKVGPHLFGVTERGPGKTEGYNYSPAFKAAADTGFAWDEEHLLQYLADPTAFLQDKSGDSKARSKMTFKLPGEEDRHNVIAYLQSLK